MGYPLFFLVLIALFLNVSTVSAQVVLEQESWFFQLLTRLHSTNPQIVQSAEEAILAYGPEIREKLLPFQNHSQIGISIQKILHHLEHPTKHSIEKWSRQTQHLPEHTLQQEILRSFLEPFSLEFPYKLEFFNQKTIEVLPFSSDSPSFSSLVQNAWIHQLDQSNYFEVIEPVLQNEATKAEIQIGGEVRWLFVQGNARLEFRLWLKSNEGYTQQFNKVLIQQGEEEYATALALMMPQIQQWIQSCLPQTHQVQENFFSPSSRLEWCALTLAQEHKFVEAIRLLDSPQTDSQRFNLALLLEATGQLSEALLQLEAVQTSWPNLEKAKTRLQTRLLMK